MSSYIFILTYIILFLLIRQVYKWRIEKKHSYKIPTKRGFGIDKSLAFYDEEVTHNKKLVKAMETLFIIEVIGVFLMFALAMYHILSYSG